MESGYKIPTRDNLHPIFDIKISRTYVHSFNVHLITWSWPRASSSRRKWGLSQKQFSKNQVTPDWGRDELSSDVTNIGSTLGSPLGSPFDSPVSDSDRVRGARTGTLTTLDKGAPKMPRTSMPSVETWTQVLLQYLDKASFELNFEFYSRFNIKFGSQLAALIFMHFKPN